MPERAQTIGEEQMNSEDIIDKLLRNVPLTQKEKDWWASHKESYANEEDLTFLQEIQGPLALTNKKMLKEELVSFERKYQDQEKNNEKKTKMFSLQRWMSIAAVGLILISSIFVFRNPQSTDPFDQYFEPYPSILNPIVKGSQSSVSSNVQIIQAYQNENYELVIQLMNTAIQNDTLSFYHANALLAMNQSEEALNIFSTCLLYTSPSPRD